MYVYIVMLHRKAGQYNPVSDYMYYTKKRIPPTIAKDYRLY